ncbi:MAG: fatty acid desaturase [Myxococcaceae bacterium]
MKIHIWVGAATLLLQAVLSVALAPAWMGPWLGLAIGMGYLLVSWFLCGVYLADVIHLGIAHRALDFREGFVKGITLLNNTVGIYVDPIAWTRRHRLHHRFSDHEGDPNKLSSDGFFKTLWLCVFPYRCQTNTATDDILGTWPFRWVSNWYFALLSPLLSCGLLWWFVRDLRYAVAVWLGVRVFALWVNMVQNYWAHDRRFGTRRYDDSGDNAMNISDWLSVTATFSACWQNNHHHYPHLPRTSHDSSEYDFGLATVRAMAKLGLVKTSEIGLRRPKDFPSLELTF